MLLAISRPPRPPLPTLPNAISSRPITPREARPMMDPIRRNMLATGAAATAAAPQVFAQVPAAQAAAQGAPTMSFYERGPVRIRYTESGAGYPLLIIPGGGLNSTIANLTTTSPF